MIGAEYVREVEPGEIVMIGADGVRSVKDQISVLPVSQFDDQLRYRIARSIYNN